MGETSSIIDFTAATTALSTMKDALVEWVGNAAPILVALAGGFLIFYLIKYVIRLVKSATKS